MRYMMIMQVEPEAAARAAQDLDMEQVVGRDGRLQRGAPEGGGVPDGGGSRPDASDGFRVDFSSCPAASSPTARTPKRGRSSRASGSSRWPAAKRPSTGRRSVRSGPGVEPRGPSRQRILRHAICPKATNGSRRRRSGARRSREFRTRRPAPPRPSGGAGSRRRSAATPLWSAAGTRGRSDAARGSGGRHSAAHRRSRRCSRPAG